MSENKKFGQEPAFPTDNFPYETTFIGEMSGKEISTTGYKTMTGMSKRFYAACAAMQGILASHANPGAGNPIINSTNNEIISASYKYADELLKQEFE